MQLGSVVDISYEPADFTVHPPPRTVKGGVFFSYRCLVFSKNVLKGKPVLFRVIQSKRPKHVIFHYIHSNPILINLTLFGNIE